MDKIELPTGLEHYEFVRSFEASEKNDHVYAFAPILLEGTFTPQMTKDNKPDWQEWSWDTVFSDDKPIELEIGSGKGGFMIEYSQLKPEINIMGSEWDGTWANYSAERIRKNHITNAAMLKGDVLFFLRDRVPSNSISAFHMYFPDPWPKKKHNKNRTMLKPEFLESIQRTAVEGGCLFYWGTDHQEYNELAQEHFAATPFVEVLEPNAEPTCGIMTNFEKKYRVEGRPIYRSVLKIHK
ncbi:MAG: tRNA (guanine-N(7)-)-methyltransferase [Fibrobacterales bacterium]